MTKKIQRDPYRAIDDKVEKAIKGEVFVSYSAYPTDDNSNPIDNLDAIAIKGKCVLVAKKEEFYGGPKSKNYESPVLKNPTWLEIAIHANEMIKTTNDHHHVFLEGVSKKKTRGDGVRIYEFSMGS